MKLFLKHGMLQTRRMGKTCVLLMTILLLFTVMIGTSATTSRIITYYMQQCKDNYHTIGVIDLPAVDLSNGYHYDNTVNELSDEVNQNIQKYMGKKAEWYPTARSLGNIEGLHRNGNNIPYGDEAVLVVKITEKLDENGTDVYFGSVKKCLSSTYEIEKELIYVSAPGLNVELGHTYLVYGKYTNASGSYKYIEVSEYAQPKALEHGIDGSIENMFVDISAGEKDYKIPEDSYFYKIADTLNAIHDSVQIYHVNDMNNCYEYQQQQIQLTQGKIFTPKEAKENAKVCILSEGLAKRINKGIGDTISLSQVSDNTNALEMTYWSEDGFDSTDEYEIKGIFASEAEKCYQVYLPYDGKNPEQYSHYNSMLGVIHFDNDATQNLSDKIKSVLPKQAQLTIYDQGYESVMHPLKELARVITIIDVIVGVIGILCLLLYSYFYVYKNKNIAKVMWLQGTGKSAIYTFYLAGGVLLSLPAVIIGSIINTVAADKLPGIVQHLMKMEHTMDARYSISALSIQKDMVFKQISFVPSALLVTFIVWLIILAICLLTTRISLPYRKKRKIRFLPNKVQGKARVSKSGSGNHYALFSIMRGKTRCVIFILFQIMSLVLFSEMNYLQKSYEKKEHDMITNTVVDGYFTDIYGRNTFGITATCMDLAAAYQTGLLDEIHYSKAMSGMYMGEGDQGKQNIEVCNAQIRRSMFALESLLCKMANSNEEVVFTSDLAHTHEFMNSSHPEIQFMDGMTEESFFEGNTKQTNVLVSEAFLKEHNLKLGDEVYFVTGMSDNILDLTATIAGSFSAKSSRNYIYLSMEQLFPISSITGESEMSEWMKAWLLDSAMFSLKAKNLTQFKDNLQDLGYTKANVAGTLRRFVNIMDDQLNASTESVRQQLEYMHFLFPVVEILLEALAILIPVLMMRSKRHEIKVMRNLGTPKHKTFWNIFMEQLLCCGCALILAVVLILLFRIQMTKMALLLSLIYVVCTQLGASITCRRLVSNQLL